MQRYCRLRVDSISHHKFVSLPAYLKRIKLNLGSYNFNGYPVIATQVQFNLPIFFSSFSLWTKGSLNRAQISRKHSSFASQFFSESKTQCPFALKLAVSSIKTQTRKKKEVFLQPRTISLQPRVQHQLYAFPLKGESSDHEILLVKTWLHYLTFSSSTGAFVISHACIQKMRIMLMHRQ